MVPFSRLAIHSDALGSQRNVCHHYLGTSVAIQHKLHQFYDRHHRDGKQVLEVSKRT